MTRAGPSRRALSLVVAGAAAAAALWLVCRVDPEAPRAGVAAAVGRTNAVGDAARAGDPATGRVGPPAPVTGDPAPAPTHAAAAPGVRGRVVDELGDPVVDFRITIAPAGGTQAGETLRGGDRLGRFEVRTTIPAPWRMAVDAPGLLTTAVDIAAPTGDGDAIVVRLRRPALVHGTTFAPDGAPIAGIGLLCRSADDPLRAVRATSGPDGRYQLAPGAEGTWVIGVEGETPTQTVVLRTGAPSQLRIDVPPATTVACTVTADGQPVAGATLLLLLPAGPRVASTDAAGTATWRCVPRGDHRLAVEATDRDSRVIGADTRDPARSRFAFTIELAARTR